MIQDIYPHVLRNEYCPAARPAPTDSVLCFLDGQLLVSEAGLLPTVQQCMQQEYRYLFSLDGKPYFLTIDPVIAPMGFHFEDVRQLRQARILPRHEMFAVLTGKHLADWYRDAQFCGRCGKRTRHAEQERAMVCPACGKTFYPRIMPAVIVGVKNGDKLLLTRYRAGGTYNALIAGFTEIGETAEGTVAREVMEEAGLRVKNIRYFASQPWGIANDLLLGFYCEVDGDSTIHMDTQELKYAQWVQREEIVLQPDDYSLTNEMMRRFKLGIEK